ncbi:MAG: hypothetical protein ACOCRX_03340 [Candidatus Woesearchaeota archaeon]
MKSKNNNNKIVIEERGIITLETESKKVQIKNELTPRGKLEILMSFFYDAFYWQRPEEGIKTADDEYAGQILVDNTDDYEYGLEETTRAAFETFGLGKRIDDSVTNSQINMDSQIYDTEYANMTLQNENLPETDIYRFELFRNIKADEFTNKDEDDEKEFDFVAIKEDSGNLTALYGFLDSIFTVEPYEQLDVTWEIELKLPDVPS